jgi:dihydrofolate synthase/folylpolyglutamate synthase
VNGHEVSESFVVEFVTGVQPLIGQLQPSFFEITAAMAFDYFARQGVDIAVVEVGMGGRLDSTNVITPILSVITNIGWDHKEHLGNTLELIASEKAGIIKAGVPVVVGERQPVVSAVFEEKSRDLESPIWFADDFYSATHKLPADGWPQYEIRGPDGLFFESVSVELRGEYQRKNIPGVMAALHRLRELGWNLNEQAIRQGLGSVATATGLKGRWQIIGTDPMVVCDTAHNSSGIAEVVSQLNTIPHDTLHLVLGMVRDKDSAGILRLLPKNALYYFCQADIPRALVADELAQIATREGRPGLVIPDVNLAIETACKAAGPHDLIFVGGSTFVVAEIRNL